MNETNWAGNHTYRAGCIHRPSSVAQVSELLQAAGNIRVLGSRHSFTDIADSGELISLAELPADVVFDRAAGTVSFSGALKYGELARLLQAEGLALANLASLPHISVAGAVATGTHGSGVGNGSLATAVAAMEIVTSSGETVTVSRGDPDFDGVVVGLGAVGAVTRVTLDVEPHYDITQRVYEGLAYAALYDHFDDIQATGYSVSVFTRWESECDQVWMKSRVDDPATAPTRALFGATPATVERHPILGIDPINCSAQLGVPGSWSDRLPHFRMGFTPSNGQELQSEYIVARKHAIAAIKAVHAMADVVQPVLQVSELRTIAADELWMSPQYQRDSVAIHFTWLPDRDQVNRVLIEVEAALAEFGARPHWGKVFLADADTISGRYPRMADFRALLGRYDPRGAFRNDWLHTRVLGA